MDIYKTGLQQSNGLLDDIKSPFNKWKISTENESVSPSSFFKMSNGESKRLVNMSPNDYFKFVSHQIGSTPEKLMEQRSRVKNQLSVDEIRKMMREGTKFDTPWLRVDDSGEPGTTSPYWQEGLHRMLAAGQEYGMDTKFPIYLGYENDPWTEIDSMSMDDFIKHYDDTRLSRYNKRKEAERLKQEEWDKLDKESTAAHFKVPIEKVTPEMIKEYQKWEDSLWTEDALEDALMDLKK